MNKIKTYLLLVLVLGVCWVLTACNFPGNGDGFSLDADRSLPAEILLETKVHELLETVTASTLSVEGGAPEVATTAVPAGDITRPEAEPTVELSATPSALPEPPENQLSIWIDPRIPQGLHQAISIPPELTPWEHPNAALRLEVSPERPISHWTYALVAPFPTLEYSVSSQDLVSSWRGDPSGPFAGRSLFMTETTYRVFSTLWGEPGTGMVQILPAEELLDTAWAQRPSWGIVPFEALEPRWKVLEVDGQSPVRSGFDPESYTLTVPISLRGDPQAVEVVSSLYGPGSAVPLLPQSNRDPDQMTVLAMTGVTALVRATAYTMEQRGLLYPGRDVGDWLRSADLTHISNEVPFANNCPYPNPVQTDVRFCSDPRYIALLEDVGTDIVELTGDHFADWGSDAMSLTLDMYQERGWRIYGGGSNIDEGRRAVIVEHNGNRLAFIGCNAKGGGFATAGPNQPGAATCAYDWMQGEIARLRADGYLPIVTFQHFEYYTYAAQPPQIRDSRTMAEAGAVIVSGSQAHQPQALEFHSDALIDYGLGNLFFDQYEVSYATRQAFIDRHVFYGGRHISTELLPILFEDYARPRPMTVDERNELLNAVFSASGW